MRYLIETVAAVPELLALMAFLGMLGVWCIILGG